MAERPNINFSLVMSEDAVKDNITSKIAFINDIKPSQVTQTEIQRLMYILNSPIFTSRKGNELLEKYLPQPSEDMDQGTASRFVGEHVQRLYQDTEVFLHDEVFYNSYGVAAPSYYNALQEYNKRHTDEKSPHASLLVGALTPATVSEYVAVTNHVFPNADLHVIDTEGITTKDAAQATATTWHTGDCLAMPFPENRFDTIQSNYLLGNINSPLQQRDSDATAAYFQQVFTTLKPDGKLISVEHLFLPTDEQTSILEQLQWHGDMIQVEAEMHRFATIHAHTLRTHLTNTGFTDISIQPATLFSFRVELDRQVMLGNAWDFSEGTSDVSILITAVKP